MNRYTIVPVLYGGYSLPEQTVTAITRKQATDIVWDSLTDAQRDVCECLDVVDEKEGVDA